MLGLMSSSNGARYSALFHIGSASIDVVLSYTEKGTTKVLWQKCLEYGYQGGDDYNRYVRTMYATLLEAGMKITSEGFKVAKIESPEFSVRNLSVQCVFGAPWFFASVYFETLRKEKTFQITSSLLDSINQSGISVSLKKQESLSWQELMGTPELLEAYFDVVKIDGYQIEKYENKMANELHTQSYLSFVSASVQEHVGEVIEKVLPNHSISFFTSTRLLSKIKEYTTFISSDSHRSILLEISGEVTSIALLQKGIIKNIATIPLGLNHILKTLFPNARSVDEARSSFTVLMKSKQKVDFANLPKTLQEELLKWHVEITDSIKRLTAGVTPPAEIVVFVDTQWQKLYESVLGTAWMVPGIRQNADFGIHFIKNEAGKNEKAVIENDVLSVVFTKLLSHYT